MIKRSLLAGAALAGLATFALAEPPAQQAGARSTEAAGMDATVPDTRNFGPWGFDLAGRDTAVRPGDDFFEYANGSYVKALQIPPDRTGWGTFDMLADLSERRVHEILERQSAHPVPNPTGSAEKAGAFYHAFMDEAAVQKRGAAPLGPDLDAIRAVRSAADFAALAGRAQTSFLGAPFDLGIAPDAKDPTRYAVTLGQSGLGLPDRDYYTAAQFAAKRAKYRAFVAHMLQLAGWAEADAAAGRVIGLEQKIAEASWEKAESRDPQKVYNPMTPAELAQAAAGFDWKAYFAAAELGDPARVVVAQKSAVLKIAAILGGTDLQTLRDWAAFHLARNAAPALSDDFVNASFDFYNHELQGQPQIRPRWKRAVAATDAALGEAVGEIYVAKYFPPDSRAKMDALTHDLRDAFRARLEHNGWMSAATRRKALEKLAAFDFQIGYPKKWRDYSSYVVRPDDAYGNIERGGAFEWRFWVSHLGHRVDRDIWDMTPQTVNAYNDPVFNQVVFPAAILQPPFFNPAADPAVNYGAIGGVIGHEMTHGFDDEGRKFDAEGRLDNWWTDEDAARFEARARKFGEEYARMEILPAAHINPQLTMGENIADLGGLTLALDAYRASLHGRTAPVLDGMSGEQRVFLGWAQVWRAKLREDAIRQRLVVDPHSPPKARVNGPMPNINGWYDAWGVKPGDRMYLAPQDRVIIW